MIYTTYFAKLKSLPKDIIPISICGKAPTGYKGLEYKKLAPRYDFFKKWKETGDNDYYIQCFLAQVLASQNPNNVIQELYTLANTMLKPEQTAKDIALVCYEKAEDFCHRHLVAEWLNAHGFECREYDK